VTHTDVWEPLSKQNRASSKAMGSKIRVFSLGSFPRAFTSEILKYKKRFF